MIVIGHRGASYAEPENTPAALAAADRMGADAVELDVRIGPDGRGSSRLVIRHDALLDDQAEIDRLAGLDEVLDACGDRMLINVEIKNTDAEGGFDPTMAVVPPTLVALTRRGPSWAERWLLSSFSIQTIDHCRRVAPNIPTAYLVYGVDETAIAAAVAGGHVAINPDERRLTADQVAACHAAGLAVNVWTCNDVDRLRELDAMGVDGACTDVPDVALAALGRDGGSPAVTPRWGRRV